MGDLRTMWASPSKIPTRISLISSGNLIKALSEEDKCLIPSVERIACAAELDTKNNKGIISKLI